MEYILVTGGLGFIGSHICVELLNNNFNVIIIDNLVNSKISTLDNIINISGNNNIKLYQEDLLNKEKILEIFKDENIIDIIHCAGLKSVNQSINLPLKYYYENLTMTFNLLEIIKLYPVNKFIFSSSATVYGGFPNEKPFEENDIIGVNITNPYGQTKYMQEIILKDYALKNKNINFIILRFFNPIGAHHSGLIGENPNGIPNNLMPYLLRVAANNNNLGFNDNVYNCLKIYGKDYETIDGTGIRDFIHVVDIAKAHVDSIKFNPDNNYDIFNLGSGKGISVLELVTTFIKINKVYFNYILTDRREGDSSVVICNVEKAKNTLNWEAKLNINDMVRDSWNFICTLKDL